MSENKKNSNDTLLKIIVAISTILNLITAVINLIKALSG